MRTELLARTERIPAERTRTGGTGSAPWLTGICAAAAVAGFPFLTRPLSPDEGGFLLVASQWHPGSSLYGSYWVNRPPLLIGIFALADHLGSLLGDAVALRLLGLGFTVVSVLLAALVGRVATVAPTRWHVLAPAVVTAVFLSTPLFGVTEVNGERLAVPFVLAACAVLLLAWRERPPSSRLLLAGAAGVLGMCAALVKQDFVDVFVLAAVVAAQQLLTRRLGARVWIAGFAAGAALALMATLVWAWSHGTSPAGLWAAVVVFRVDAASVIGSYAVNTFPPRLHNLVVSCVLSGAPLVVAASLWAWRRPAASAARSTESHPVDLRWPAAAVVLWEAAAVVMGGSYWLHYLIGLVPGIVLVGVAAGQRVPGRWRPTMGVATTYAAVVAATTVLTMALHPPADQNAAVVTYLRGHSVSGDTVVVGFGNPVIVQRSGMSSPYPLLWSLPVRVLDSHLVHFAQVLEGPDRPTWVVVGGAGLATWGVDAGTAQSVLERRYHESAAIGDALVYRVDPSDPGGPHSTG